MKLRTKGLLILCLCFASSAVLASGGVWKIGPFGPYWDDNDWPEYTPMYWMEEFINNINDDDDEILDWMRLNQQQNPVYAPGANLPGNGPLSSWGYPYSNSPTNPMGQSFANPRALQFPRNNNMNSYAYRQGQRRGRDFSDLPDLSQAEFERMPRAYQDEYMRVLSEMRRANMQQSRSRTRYENRRYRPQLRRPKKSGCFAG